MELLIERAVEVYPMIGTAVVLSSSALILGGGLDPQPGIASRYHAVMDLGEYREAMAAPLRDDKAILKSTQDDSDE